MWKILAILAVVSVVLASAQKPLPMNGGNQQEHPQAHSDHAQPDTPPPCTTEVCKENAENAERYAYYKAHPKEYLKTAIAPANLSNWILAGLGVIGGLLALGTLLLVKRQADHIVCSERAWMIAEISGPLIYSLSGIPYAMAIPQLWNKGKTPAFIVEAGGAIVIKNKNEALPKIPPDCKLKNVATWDGIGVPLAPGGDIKQNLIDEVPELPQVLSGQKILWIYGYVKYHNTFTKRARETRYCFQWDPSMHGRSGSTFAIDGPKGYNRAT